jgi:hypothetical protein
MEPSGRNRWQPLANGTSQKTAQIGQSATGGNPQVHADAATLEQTDWPQIVTLYDQLLAVAPTPVVALNRAIAIGELQGPATALALLNDLTPPGPICFSGSAGTRPPTNVQPPWRRQTPSGTSSGSAAELRAERATMTPSLRNGLRTRFRMSPRCWA